MEEYFINELALATAAAEIPDEVRHRMLEQGYCTDAIIGYMILGMKKIGFSFLNTQKAIEGVKAALKENTAVEAEQTSLRDFFQDLDVDLITIKDLGLPEQLENDLLDFVYYSKESKLGNPNLLLVGCPLRTLPRLLKAIANEMGVKLKLVDGRTPLPPSELSEMLDNLSSNDGVYLAHIEKLKPESLHIFEQILFANEVEFLGSDFLGVYEYFSPFSTIASVENMDQVPKGFESAFYIVVDFTSINNEK